MCAQKVSRPLSNITYTPFTISAVGSIVSTSFGLYNFIIHIYGLLFKREFKPGKDLYKAVVLKEDNKVFVGGRKNILVDVEEYRQHIVVVVDTSELMEVDFVYLVV